MHASLKRYLSEDELNATLGHIASLTLPGSMLVATFLGDSAKPPTPMHRFFTTDAPGLLSRFGWRASQQLISDLGRKHGRRLNETAYYMADAVRVATSSI
jgi:hypothetical protein